jgi:hypothetical protein
MGELIIVLTEERTVGTKLYIIYISSSNRLNLIHREAT